MAFFPDFAAAMNSYLADSVTLSIVLNLATDNIPPATDLGINTGEKWKFKVRVTNDGQLNLINMVLHIQGQNEALVSTAAAGPFSDEIHPGSLTVNAHSSQDSAYFYFQAPDETKPAGTELVTVHVSTYDSNLQHLLDDHSDHSDPPSGVYAAQVFI